MRWILCSTGLICALAACGPEREPLDYTKPHRYRVLRGDTWQSVSSKREVEPEAVKRWNGLRDDHKLIPGQTLWVFPQGKGAPKPGEHPAVAAARYLDPDAAPPAVGPAPQRPANPDGIVDAAPDDAPDPDGPQAAAGTADPPSGQLPTASKPGGTQRIDGADFGPGGTSLLSLLDEVEPSPKLEAVPSIARDDTPIDSVLAGRKGNLGGGGEVDRTQVEIDRVVKPKPGPKGPGKIPTLPKAEAKQCLPATITQDVGDYGIAGAAGLGKGAIKSGMRPVLYAAQACLPGGGGGPHELHLEVSIGCDGLVYDTRIVKSAGLDAPVTDCVAAVADQASFAAAAGATTFLYPVVLGY